jgi:hypothetical protein
MIQPTNTQQHIYLPVIHDKPTAQMLFSKKNEGANAEYFAQLIAALVDK